MLNLNSVEADRLHIQQRLDAQKSPQERNRLGQFATPPPLALEMLTYARSLLDTESVRFLDPALGTGAFYSAFLSTFEPQRIQSALGYEIDLHYAAEAVKLWKAFPLTIHIEDFTEADPPHEDQKATLVICNPPYVRHHHLDPDEKVRLRSTIQRLTGVSLNGLSGLYCYFLGLAHGWMAQDALAGWLIPSEFMDVAYGKQIQEYLLQKVTLLRIHRFNAQDVQFNDALVSSAVVWFRNRLPPADHVVQFTYGGSLATPQVTTRISVSDLAKTKKWNLTSLQNLRRSPTASRKTLSEYFTIKRGLATGANHFFILSKEQIKAYELPEAFVKPILPSPRYLKDDVIPADRSGDPLLTSTRYLLSCNLPEHVLRTYYPSLWHYLQKGIAEGIHTNYLCRHRSPWYSQENRPSAPLLCTYMNRQNAVTQRAFRFILNHSNATAPNVYLMLYPKPDLAEAIINHPELTPILWTALNSISVETLKASGRSYGGGLHKTEPKELGQVSADVLVQVLQPYLPAMLI